MYMDKENGDKFCIFTNKDDISGDVAVKMRENSSFDHIGIQIELIGEVSEN
jgi:hypothetical protein